MMTFGQPHRHLAQCASTNDVARAWAQDENDPAPSGALVTADFQTAGRGRRGRGWQAGFGLSALMSFVYRPPSELSDLGQIGLVTGLAVASALETFNLQPQIKWPNDVLLDEKKAAGILVELFFSAGEETTFAVLGIGVNVGQERFVGDAGYAYPPTSLRLATGHSQEVAPVIQAVAHSLTQWERRWRQEGFAPVLDECRKRLALGAQVRQGEMAAELVGLADDGLALVRLPDGTFAQWTAVD